MLILKIKILLTPVYIIRKNIENRILNMFQNKIYCIFIVFSCNKPFKQRIAAIVAPSYMNTYRICVFYFGGNLDIFRFIKIREREILNNQIRNRLEVFFILKIAADYAEFSSVETQYTKIKLTSVFIRVLCCCCC